MSLNAMLFVSPIVGAQTKLFITMRVKSNVSMVLHRFDVEESEPECAQKNLTTAYDVIAVRHPNCCVTF